MILKGEVVYTVGGAAHTPTWFLLFNEMVSICLSQSLLSHNVFTTLCMSHIYHLCSSLSLTYPVCVPFLFLSLKRRLLLFSLSTLWNVVLSIIVPCNYDTSSSISPCCTLTLPAPAPFGLASTVTPQRQR